MKKFWFWIRRKHAMQVERICVEAKSDWDAINKLPRCVYWDYIGTRPDAD